MRSLFYSFFVPALFVWLWSTGFIGAKYGLPFAEPFTLLLIRMLMTLVLLAGLAWIMKTRWPGWRGAGHLARPLPFSRNPSVPGSGLGWPWAWWVLPSFCLKNLVLTAPVQDFHPGACSGRFLHLRVSPWARFTRSVMAPAPIWWRAP